MGITLHMIAGTLAATRPDAAATILGAPEAHVIEAAANAQLITATAATALGEDRTKELRARGAGMDWDQAVAYTLTKATQALSESQPATQPSGAAVAAHGVRPT
jgi:hypothetical protein